MKNKPQVQLLTLWAYDYPMFDADIICCGLWVTSSVKTEQDRRIYTLTCCDPHSNKVKIGDARLMEEEIILTLCTEFKVVKQPKRKFIEEQSAHECDATKA